MIYLLGIDKNGKHGAGMSYIIITNYKSLRKQKEVANSFKRHNTHLAAVYGITNYTQAMCEMGNQEIADYIIKHGILLA